MKNFMEVKLRKNNNNISYTYTVTGPWREAFNLDGIDGWFALSGNGVHDFFIEYDMNVESVPNSIAIIPFICNVLPIAWLYDAEIHVDEIDKDFYNSVEGFKKGYLEMYPSMSFKGGLIANKIIKNRHPIIHNALYPFKRNRAIIFFSGGVDANFTLLSNLDEKPMLLTLWGSDLFFNNKDDWEEVSNKHYNTARKLGFKNDEETQKAIGRMLKEGKIQPNNYYREMVEKFRSDGKWEGEYHVQALLEVYQD